MRWLAILPMAASGLVIAVVAARLLALARRTRELPELALGLGLALASVVGLPLATAGRAPAWIGTPMGDGLFVAGVVVSHAGLALLLVFTWSVFRRGAPVALAAIALGGAVLAGAAYGLVSAGTGDSDMHAIFARTRPHAATTIGVVALFFVWNALEALGRARMLARRRALGLGDPVVHNRFQLWSLIGASSAVLCGVLGAYVAAGRPPLVERAPILLCAVTSSLGGLAWYLAFLPPARYVRWVRARAAASQAASRACA